MNIPPYFKRILIAADNDPAGQATAQALTERYSDRQIMTLLPNLDVFNDELMAIGVKRHEGFDQKADQIIVIIVIAIML